MCINLWALPWANLFSPFRARRNKGFEVIIGSLT